MYGSNWTMPILLSVPSRGMKELIQNGSFCGVRKQFRGQPARLPKNWQYFISTASMSGRSSRSTLMQMNWEFRPSAMTSSPKLSRSMTWHQWHVA